MHDRFSTGARALLGPLLVGVPAAGLVGGLIAQWSAHHALAQLIWAAATLPVLAALFAEIVLSLRQGEYGLDIVAALSMSAALLFEEYLAASVVALMYAGGQYLEAFAGRRARQEMTALLEKVPRTAIRHEGDALREVPIEQIEPGDRLLIRRGDTVPVDGAIESTVALLDESALTGESLPVRRHSGEAVMSGSTNIGDVFDLIGTHSAKDSTYAGIVRLVELAQRSKAPMSRLADQYSLGFLVLTLAIAGLAWIASGDARRAVAVLVVATPCPLILAVPIALVSGLSRAARLAVLIKGGKALEALAQIRSIVIDKTGTLTHGKPTIASVVPKPPFAPDDVLRLAASLDQASKHPMAQMLVSEARQRGLQLSVPTGVTEAAGAGIEGIVEGHRLFLGGTNFVAKNLNVEPKALRAGRDTPPGAVTIALGADGKYAGEIVLSDELRSGSNMLITNLRQLGIKRIVLATGDRRDVAEAVTKTLPVDAIHADLTPEQKVGVVVDERKHGPVMMIGDGVNDAPALAAADIGVAMGARGAAASAQAADVVLLIDRLDRVLSAIQIARRSRNIAVQSIYAGIGLSLIGMVVAAFGLISPVEGALLQEVIDVAVILNALRALQDR
jgi:heavy metal translocating P-type ATPase